MDPHLAAKIAPYIVPLLIVALVARRLIRNPPRKVKPGRLFIVPAFVLLATALTLTQAPRFTLGWIGLDILAALSGAGAGYLTARHREFALDTNTGEITSRATPLGTIVFAVLFALRFGLKLAFPQLNGGQSYGTVSTNLHPAASAIGWTDAGLIFSAAMLTASATTTWFRTRHLAAARRAAKAAAPPEKPAG